MEPCKLSGIHAKCKIRSGKTVPVNSLPDCGRPVPVIDGCPNSAIRRCGQYEKEEYRTSICLPLLPPYHQTSTMNRSSIEGCPLCCRSNRMTCPPPPCPPKPNKCPPPPGPLKLNRCLPPCARQPPPCPPEEPESPPPCPPPTQGGCPPYCPPSCPPPQQSGPPCCPSQPQNDCPPPCLRCVAVDRGGCTRPLPSAVCAQACGVNVQKCGQNKFHNTCPPFDTLLPCLDEITMDRGGAQAWCCWEREANQSQSSACGGCGSSTSNRGCGPYKSPIRSMASQNECNGQQNQVQMPPCWPNIFNMSQKTDNDDRCAKRSATSQPQQIQRTQTYQQQQSCPQNAQYGTPPQPSAYQDNRSALRPDARECPALGRNFCMHRPAPPTMARDITKECLVTPSRVFENMASVKTKMKCTPYTTPLCVPADYEETYCGKTGLNFPMYCAACMGIQKPPPPPFYKNSEKEKQEEGESHRCPASKPCCRHVPPSFLIETDSCYDKQCVPDEPPDHDMARRVGGLPPTIPSPTTWI